MSHRITRIAPLPAAKLFGTMYFILGLVFAPLFALPALLSGGEAGAGFGIGFAIAMPILYGVTGFIGVAIFTWLFNVLSARVGGIEVDVADASEGADTLSA